MREYTTQMDAAKKGIITPEMKKVAEKEISYRRRDQRSGGKRPGGDLR